MINIRFLLSCLVVLLFLSAVALPSCVVAKEALAVYLDSSDLILSKDQKNKLQSILSKSLGHEVKFVSRKFAAEAQIKLSTTMKQSKGWHRALYSIDQVPEFISVSLPKNHTQELVGQISGAYGLTRSDSYALDNIENAISMLKSGRLDAVIDIRGNQFYYRINQQAFRYERIRPSSYLFVDFKDIDLMKRYDNRIWEFADLTDTQPVDQAPKKQNHLKLVRIGKVFDAKKQRLVASNDELEASLWLGRSLPQFDIEFIDTNSIATLDMIRNGENICALNVRKNEEREKVGVFTLPSRLFLSLKLFVKKSVPQWDKLNLLQNHNSRIDLVNFLSANPDGLIALSENVLRYNALGGEFQTYFSANNKRFVTVKREDNFKGFELLRQDRVDYLFEYPASLKAFVEGSKEIEDYDSFEINGAWGVTKTHIICSDNQIGRHAKSAIDLLIRTEHQRAKWVEFYTRGLTNRDQSRYFQAYESLIENSNL